MIDTRLEEILKQLENHERRILILEKSMSPKGAAATTVDRGSTNPSDDLVLSIINKVGDCEESANIQSQILEQKGLESKILLCFYISCKYFENAWLTSGNIEKITSGLGIKISMGNVSNKIKKEVRPYLESGSVRKNGLPTPCRINRKGIKRLEEILHATKA